MTRSSREPGPGIGRRALLGAAPALSYALAVDGRRFFTPDEEPLPPTPAPALATHAELATREPHMCVQDWEVDVLVAGGGMAGVCAALAAALRGASVLLVQDRSRLGGNASSEIRMHIVGADHHGNRAGWREGGLIEEIRLEDAVHNPHRAWELFDLRLYDLCMREPTLALRLDTSIYSARKEDGRIVEVLARCDKTETIHRVRPKVCIDCTGDARLALEAGASYREGREARAEFDEPLAQVEGDAKSQGSTILFTAREHDREMPFVAPPWARQITEDDLLFRGIPQGSYEYGYWWIELGGTRDVIRDNEELRHELLRIVLGVWDWIKNSGKRRNSANWALETVGMIPGKRESRRVEGDHIHTWHDLSGGWKQRDDGVSIGGWPFDDHPPEGFDDPKQPPFWSRPIDDVYNVAFEALYSRDVPNLLMAGRNVSNSHVAFTSTRVMATCACMGQAVGTAAALCAREGLTPRELRATAMGRLQQELLRDDQSIRGVVNQDPEDLARSARISASAHLPEAPPEHVVDGHVRDMPGEWTHRWGAELADGPQWLELRWERPQALAQVQITFDSGFHRELTLSAQNGRSKKMVRAPQPETVRDYDLVGIIDGRETLLAEVRGNYQRLRRHAVEADALEALRLIVFATNGAPQARVFEVRCYA